MLVRSRSVTVTVPETDMPALLSVKEEAALSPPPTVIEGLSLDPVMVTTTSPSTVAAGELESVARIV